MFGTESLSGVVSALLPTMDSPGRAAGSRRADDPAALAGLAARLRCYFVLYVVGRWDSCVRDDAGLFTLRVTPAPYGPRLCQVMLRAGRALENLEGVRARWRRLAGRGPGAGSAFLNSAAAGAGCFVGAWEGVHARRGCAERVGEALCERVSEALCERVSEALCERVVCVPAEHCRSDSPSTSGGRVPCAGRSFLGARGADRSRWWSRPRRTASAGPATASASPPAPTARGAAGPPPPRRTPLPDRACSRPAAIGRLRPGPGPSQGRAPRSDSGRVSRWRGSAPPPRQAAGSRPPAGSGIRRHGSGPERGPRGLAGPAVACGSRATFPVGLRRRRYRRRQVLQPAGRRPGAGGARGAGRRQAAAGRPGVGLRARRRPAAAARRRWEGLPVGTAPPRHQRGGRRRTGPVGPRRRRGPARAVRSHAPGPARPGARCPRVRFVGAPRGARTGRRGRRAAGTGPGTEARTAGRPEPVMRRTAEATGFAVPGSGRVRMEPRARLLLG